MLVSGFPLAGFCKIQRRPTKSRHKGLENLQIITEIIKTSMVRTRWNKLAKKSPREGCKYNKKIKKKKKPGSWQNKLNQDCKYNVE